MDASDPVHDDPLMTTKELAVYLNAPLSWIYHHAQDIPRYRVGRGLRFRRSEVAEWVAAQRIVDSTTSARASTSLLGT